MYAKKHRDDDEFGKNLNFAIAMQPVEVHKTEIPLQF
jgi:hypothetical protein